MTTALGLNAFYGDSAACRVINSIVCTPDEALDCFLRTHMDLLAIGDTLLTASGHPTH